MPSRLSSDTWAEAVRGSPSDLDESYRAALREYLTHGGEASLLQAYELGRQALDSGVGLLGLVNIHEGAVSQVMEKSNGKTAQYLHDAHHFLLESMAPFEMMQIGHREANAALRRLNNVLEDEAKRIAHTLHDEAAQLLASVYLELAEIQRLMPPDPIRSHTERISSQLDMVSDQLRRLSHELRPPILDQLGLMPALQFLSDGFRKRAGLKVDIDNFIADRGRLPQLIETALYRTVQEALNNVVKHAKAKQVRVRIWIEQQLVCCTIKDDGAGFQSSGGPDGLGLVGIRERISSLHGAFEINSRPGSGTELRVSIPLGENL
ncbi:MAG TPA: ATP-binding protein [Gammaproteobacteria bacterium]|jgi:signal transduction histidine kinase